MYRKSLIRSRPLIQVCSIRGRTLQATNATKKHKFHNFFEFSHTISDDMIYRKSLIRSRPLLEVRLYRHVLPLHIIKTLIIYWGAMRLNGPTSNGKDLY